MDVWRVKYTDTDTADGPRLADVGALLALMLLQRACRSRATAPAIGALLWWSGWRAYGGPRYVVDTLIGAAIVVPVVRWRRRRGAAPLPYEPDELQSAQDDVDYWCGLGSMRSPQVLRYWRTETGHAYYLRVTSMTDREGKPMSTATFKGYGAYLRDLVGAGCHSVQIEIDPKNGGRATMYVNFAAPPEQYRKVVEIGYERRVCTSPEQYELALAAAEEWERSEAQRAERGAEARRWSQIVENPDHYARTGDLTEEEWERLEDELPVAYARITGQTPSGDDPDSITPASLTPETALPGPLPEVLITEVSGQIIAEEGTGAAFAPPSGAPVQAPRPGLLLSDGAREVAWLLRDGVTRRRGQIADELDQSPAAIDRDLAELAATGLARKVGSAWSITTSYGDASIITQRGDQASESA